MATTLPSKFVPLVGGLSGGQGVRRRRVQFGEGYVHQSVDGTNSDHAELRFNFFLQNDADLNELTAILDTGEFDYTLPNSSTEHTYEVRGLYDITYLNLHHRNLSVDARRLY